MTSLAIPIIWCILQVSLLCVVGGLVYLAVRTFEPRLGRTSVAVLLMLVLVLSLAALSPWPSWQIFASGPSAAAEPAERTADAASPGPAAAEGTGAASTSFGVRGQQPASLFGTDFWQAMWDELNRPAAAREPPAAATADAPWHWSSLVLVFLSVAAAIGGLRLAAACFALRRWKRASTPIDSPQLTGLVGRLQREMGAVQDVELREAAAIQSAATIGWRRPVVLLPSAWLNWPEQELRAVLAHELAHVRAADWPAWLVAQIAVTLHFYHPLVHWLSRRLRLEQELAADAAAAAVTGSKEDYLGTLAAQMLRAERARLTWAVFAETFLPTRSTIVRRIEMLKSKSPRFLSGKLPGRARRGVASALVLLCVAVAGLRAPGSAEADTDLGNERASGTPQFFERQGASERQFVGLQANDEGQEPDWDVANLPPVHSDALYVDANALLFLRIRPAAILSGRENDALRAQINGVLSDNNAAIGGLRVEDIESVAFAPNAPSPNDRAELILIQFNKPLDQTGFAKTWSQFKPAEEVNGLTIYTPNGEKGGRAAYLSGTPARPNSFVAFDSSYTRMRSRLGYLSRGKNALPEWLSRDKLPDDDPQLFLAVNMDAVRSLAEPQIRRGGVNDMPLAMLKPLIDKPSLITVTGEVHPGLTLQAQAFCANEDDARQVAATAEALRTLGRNLLAQQRDQLRNPDARLGFRPGAAEAGLMEKTMDFMDTFLKNVKFDSAGNVAQGRVEAGAISQPLIQAAVLLPAIQSARQAARRAQSVNNLKQLALAMLTYEDAHGRFPPPVVTGPDGKTKHSWRVALLPFMEQATLYDEYRLTEPWDSEHNKRLLERMPDVFRSPTDPDGTTTSAYYVLVGEETIFPPEGEGVKLTEIKDGTSKTFLIVEAKRDIPWTKPEDIPLKSGEQFPQLGGHFEGIFLAAFADGSVFPVDSETDPTILWPYVTKMGGERTVPLPSR